MNSKVLIALSILFLFGCASVQQGAVQQVIGTDHVSQKNYTLGQPSVAVVGGDVIRVKDYSVTKTASNQVKVVSSFKLEGALAFSKQFNAGEIYPFGGTTEHDGKVLNIMKIDNGMGVLFDDGGVVYHKLVAGLDPVGFYAAQPVFPIYSYDVTPEGSHLARVVNESSNSQANGQNYQIIFTGITSDSIRMSYREFTPDDLARAAFSQDLTYPLKAKEIRFRNLTIDVISVSPDQIQYKVIAD